MSQRIENIAVDMGKSEVKALRFTDSGEIIKSVNFDSVIQKHLTCPSHYGNVNPNKYIVKFDGRYYEVGDELEEGSYSDENTKLNLHHKLCLLLAVGLLIDDDKPFVNLTVSLPASHIANPREKENFEKMIKEDEEKAISIEINGKEKVFAISKITPDSEGLAMMPRLKAAMSKNRYDIAVIDIGGHNFNARVFNHLGMAKTGKGMSQEQVGINHLLSKLHEALLEGLEDRNRSITTADLKRFVKERKLDEDMIVYGFEDNSQEFVDTFVKNYIESNIIRKLSAYKIKVNAKGMMYLFTGGGSNLLRPYLEEMLEDNMDYIIFSETSKWDNALSIMINYLFNRFADKKRIFDTVCKETNSKLNNEDKTLALVAATVM